MNVFAIVLAAGVVLTSSGLGCLVYAAYLAHTDNLKMSHMQIMLSSELNNLFTPRGETIIKSAEPDSSI